MRSIPRSSRSLICPFSSDVRISSSLTVSGVFFGRPMFEICNARNTRTPGGTVV
jgi:hypothetical protein